MPAAQKALCFSIDGDFLTDHCRSLWALEDRPDHAIKTLMTGLVGITYDQTLGILEGRFKLVGNSNDATGVRLVEDTATHIQGQKLPTLAEVTLRMKEARDEALDARADIIQITNGDTVQIPSPTGLRSVPTRKTVYKAKDNRRVLKPGFDWEDQPVQTKEKGSKPVKYFRQEPPRSASAGPVVSPSVISQYKPRPKPFKCAQCDRMVSVVSSFQGKKVCHDCLDDLSEPALVYYPEITQGCGWLSPEGWFYPCDFAQHEFLAQKLGSHQHKMDETGWIKVAKDASGTQHLFGFTGKARFPTVIQKKLVIDFCELTQTKLPWFMEEDESKST